MRVEGDMLRCVAKHGSSQNWPIGTARPFNRDWVTGRAVIDRTTVHVPDLQAAEREFPEGVAYARQYGHRTTLATPLLREGSAIGAILIRRMEVRPFTDKQIDAGSRSSPPRRSSPSRTRGCSTSCRRARASSPRRWSSRPRPPRCCRSFQQLARRAGAGVPGHAGECDAHLRGQVRHAVPARR